MQKYFYTIFSVSLILFLLGISLLFPGGIFVLDFVITPFTSWQSWQATTVQWHIVDLLNYVLWYAWTSKLYYIFVLWFWCFAAGKLWKLMHNFLILASPLWITQASFALFLLCNPWVYERLITQPWIALWMFCMLLWITYLLENIIHTQKNSLIWASLSFGFAFMCFPHASLMIFLIALLYIPLFFKHIPWKHYIIAPILVLLPNINWLIGDIVYKKDLWTTSLQAFDWANIEWFVWNNLSGLGSDLTQLLLYGFWGERYHIKTPDMFSEYWYIFGFIALAVIIFWNIRLFTLHKKLWIFFTFLWTIAYILWVGINSDIFWPLNIWFFENIPGYIGMREPQKWIGLTMIVYSICFTLGMFTLWKQLRWMSSWIFLVFVFVLLNTWNPMNIFAYQKQLYGIIVPNEYQKLAREEITEHPDARYLVLPWHSYMSCDWTRWKNISSMQKRYFYPLNTIVSDNLELDTKYTNSSSQVSQNIETYLNTKDYSTLKTENIDYIIYQKNCANTSSWEYLKEDDSLQLIKENNSIALYKIIYEK